MPRTIVFGLLAALGAPAQMFGPEVPGSRNPQWISAIALVGGGSLIGAPPISPKGHVSTLIRQEFRAATGWQDWKTRPERTIEVGYDAAQHETQRVEIDATGNQTKTVRLYERGTLQSETSEFTKDGNRRAEPFSLRYFYDEKGRIIDARRVRGENVENRLFNFVYDADGRVTHREFEQKSNKFSYREEIAYKKNSIEVAQYGADGEKFYASDDILDESGNVIELKLYGRDSAAKALKLSLRARFGYDEKRRLVSQENDAKEFKPGDDNYPPPGKVVVTYDDTKLTRTVTYTSPQGDARSLTFQLDRDGTSLSIGGAVNWEVDYDAQGNWTERRRWAFPPNGGQKVLTNIVRQLITYVER